MRGSGPARCPHQPTEASNIDAKLPHRIAQLIEKKIIEEGWRIDTPIGSETDLAAEFGVSRAVMREAVSIAEHDGLIVSRRGRQGGLWVAGPALDAVSRSVRNYLHYSSVDLDSILSTRSILETLMIDLAGRHMRAQDHAIIKAAADQAALGPTLHSQIDLLDKLLDIAGNPALAVFLTALIDLILLKIFRRNIPTQRLLAFNKVSSTLRLQYVDAMYGLDFTAAHIALARLVGEVRELLDSTTEVEHEGNDFPMRVAIEMMVSPKELPLPFKGAELLTHRIHSEILRRKLVSGDALGTEAELLKKFNVGRSVLREAIRPLERLGIVQMRQRIGLTVQKPDATATIRSVVLYLEHAGLTREKIYAIQHELELAGAADLARLAADRRIACSHQLRDIIEQQAPDDIQTAQAQVRAFYLCFIDHLPNQVMAFFLRILCEMVTLAAEKNWSQIELVAVWEDIRRAQRYLVDMIDAGGASSARRALYELKIQLDRLMPTSRTASASLRRSPAISRMEETQKPELLHDTQ